MARPMAANIPANLAMSNACPGEPWPALVFLEVFVKAVSTLVWTSYSRAADIFATCSEIIRATRL